MLLARNARLHRGDKNQLEKFLRTNPNPQEAIRREEERKAEERRRAEEARMEEETKRAEEERRAKEKKAEEIKKEEQALQQTVNISMSVRQRMREGTLQKMSDEAITQELMTGRLASGFSYQLHWANIVTCVEKHQAVRSQSNEPIAVWRQEQATIDAQRLAVQRELQRLQQQLLQLHQKYEELEEHIQEHAKALATADLFSLLQFARRVQPIEQRLVAELEEEMREERVQLAALSDKSSSQPKLSLLLNCMGVSEAAIAATGDLDSTAFKRLTKRHDFVERYRLSGVSAEDIMDLLWCGEMMRDSDFPFEDHIHDCAVCANHSAQQLINFIRERGIALPVEVLTSKNINGKRILYCAPSDFPRQEKLQWMDAVDRLRELHEQAM